MAKRQLSPIAKLKCGAAWPPRCGAAVLCRPLHLPTTQFPPALPCAAGPPLMSVTTARLQRLAAGGCIWLAQPRFLSAPMTAPRTASRRLKCASPLCFLPSPLALSPICLVHVPRYPHILLPVASTAITSRAQQHESNILPNRPLCNNQTVGLTSLQLSYWLVMVQRGRAAEAERFIRRRSRRSGACRRPGLSRLARLKTQW